MNVGYLNDTWVWSTPADSRTGPWPMRRLDDAQSAVIREKLLKGPQAHGFATGVWTLGRIAIERLTGVTYGPTQTWTTIRERMGRTPTRRSHRAG